MYFRQNLRTPGVLNIFTDSGFDKDTYNMYVSFPGFVAVTTKEGVDYVIGDGVKQIENSTSNNGEINAISMGIDFAIQNKDKYEYINLFSDSQYCVNSLREWIFKWLNCKKKKYNEDTGAEYIDLCNSTKSSVENQSEFLTVIKKIIDNNLNICIYHVKGHVSNTPKDLQMAHSLFCKSNYFDPNLISLDDIGYISYYNDMVDRLGSDLKSYYSLQGTKEKVVSQCYYQGLDFNKYSKLLNLDMLKKKGE